MNKPQPIHPDIPTYKELQERISELEQDIETYKAENIVLKDAIVGVVDIISPYLNQEEIDEVKRMYGKR